MLEIVIAQIPGKCQVFFNISGNVGLRSPNDSIDVQLVQLGYACAAINPANSAPPDVKAIWRNVNPGSPYSGTPQDVLSQAIAAHEGIKGISQDGRISRMAGGQLRHAGPRGSEPFLLSNLCNNIFDIMASTYPRIDLNQKCPPVLGAHIKSLFKN